MVDEMVRAESEAVEQGVAEQFALRPNLDEPPEFLGGLYNLTVWKPKDAEHVYFQQQAPKAGEAAPDFTLPLLGGGEVTLSSLRGKPVMMEFGSIT